MGIELLSSRRLAEDEIEPEREFEPRRVFFDCIDARLSAGIILDGLVF